MSRVQEIQLLRVVFDRNNLHYHEGTETGYCVKWSDGWHMISRSDLERGLIRPFPQTFIPDGEMV